MDNLDKLSLLVDKERCQQVLTNPDEVGEALEVLVGMLDDRVIPPMAVWVSNRMAAAIRELHARLRTAKADLTAAREDVARIERERDRALKELQEMDAQWRPVDLGPKGEWFMGRLKDGTEKALRRLPGGSSYEYSDVNETYYSWYWLTHWRPLTDDERAAIDSARAGGGKEPIRASGDCICSVCGKRYGDHPTDKVVLSAIDSLPFLHVLCDGTRVKL